jgi:DNA mismatch repair ATPase MutS
MVLALAGAPVCAKKFSCPIMGLRSGMRTTDSLQENQSYFYAELFRLKRIMDELREGKPLLILLDEILKGTNSNDKQSGSIAIVEQLVTLNGLVLLATHDVALGDLQQRFPTKVSNVCFESEVDGDRLTFDYELKKGVAQKANATFLMREMGIIPRMTK